MKKLLVGLLPFVLFAATPNEILNREVRHELVMLPYYGVFDNLAYRVDAGKVTLFGEVTRPTLKTDAEAAVKKIEGVVAVDNQIEVLPLSPNDDQIRRSVYRAIFAKSDLERYQLGAIPPIHILVKDGNVTLIGNVSSDLDKNVAGMAANGVPGVHHVDNQLVVSKG